MAQNKVVVGTIVKKSYTNSLINAITIKSELGTITIERGKNWDGGIDWEGKWCQGLKVGDLVDLIQDGKRYGFYMLGSLLDSPARGEEEQRKTKKIMNFINSQEQDVAVKGCIQLPSTSSGCPHETYVECWSPVWGNFNYTSTRIDIQIGDILTVRRDKLEHGYHYRTLQNHTSDERLHKASNKILKDFDEAEVKKILLMACQQKMEK